MFNSYKSKVSVNEATSFSARNKIDSTLICLITDAGPAARACIKIWVVAYLTSLGFLNVTFDV